MLMLSTMLALAFSNTIKPVREKWGQLPHVRNVEISLNNQSRVMREKFQIQIAKCQQHIDFMTNVVCEIHGKYDRLENATNRDLQRLLSAERSIQFNENYIDFLKTNLMLNENDRRILNK